VPARWRGGFLCQTRAHAEILPEHWLLNCWNREGDLTVLARR
jgi:hypothetical protein